MTIDDEITSFAASRDGRIESLVPLLDELVRAHPELAPAALVEEAGGDEKCDDHSHRARTPYARRSG